tara:strand:- start:954 stop:1124 length:171 start_codon:yes stop_codon:yes gene_type:complete
MWSKGFVPEEVYKELHSKHFKSFYAGQATKRYIRIMKNLKEAGQFNQRDIERIMIS